MTSKNSDNTKEAQTQKECDEWYNTLKKTPKHAPVRLANESFKDFQNRVVDIIIKEDEEGENNVLKALKKEYSSTPAKTLKPNYSAPSQSESASEKLSPFDKYLKEDSAKKAEKSFNILDKEDETESKLNKFFSDVPAFGEKIYKECVRLVPMSEHLLKNCDNDREKDSTLLGFMAQAGAYYGGNHRVLYNKKFHYTTLNLCVFAPSSSGKEMLKIGKSLFDFENKKRTAEHKEEVEIWNNIQKANKKNEGEFNSMEEPVERCLHLGGSFSDSRLIQLLNANNAKRQAMTLFYGELDGISGKIGGQHNETFTSILREAFDHGEGVVSTKGDNRTLRARNMKMGFCASGTFDQIVPFFGGHNAINGILPRFLMYTFHAKHDFKSNWGTASDVENGMEERHRIHCEQAIKATLTNVNDADVTFIVRDEDKPWIAEKTDNWGQSIMDKHGDRYDSLAKRSMCQVARMTVILMKLSEKYNNARGTVFIEKEYLELAFAICSNLVENTILTTNIFIHKQNLEIDAINIYKQEQRAKKEAKEIKDALVTFNSFKIYVESDNFVPSTFYKWYMNIHNRTENNKTAVKNIYMKIKNIVKAKGLIIDVENGQRGEHKFTTPYIH